MFQVLKNQTYRRLFLAQVIALLGTGMVTVALSLLAFDLAGASAGAVLGTALAIKMVAYIGVAPIASAFAERIPRRAVLVTLDLVRAGAALLLPFVTAIWQVYLLIFILQAASAGFTPTFQATIPEVLPEEEDYTNALSLSRLAYDLESLVSPLLAAALLTMVSFHTLFGGTVIGFVASALLVVSAVLPKTKVPQRRGIYDRTTRGTRIYLATPRLRGLLALNLAIAAGSAMVIVNTVVLVQSQFGMTQRATAVAFAMFGGGSMLMALLLPRLLRRFEDRAIMLAGGTVIAVSMVGGGWMLRQYEALLVLWFILGVGYSLAQTPSGRLLRRSAQSPDLPALFAAQFALSHACWLLTYPIAGWLGAKLGLGVSFLVLGIIALVALALSALMWRGGDAAELAHRHDDLTAEDPHFLEGRRVSPHEHEHTFHIDDQHQRWPR